jgi:amino acid permease
VEAVAITAAAIVGVVSLFQMALAAGAPWGEAAYGGMFPGVLPTGMRVNSLVFAVVMFPAVALYLLDIGGVLESSWLPGSRTFVIWVLVVFFALGTLMNAISRSRVERVLWTPVNAVLLICCLALALN